eukprot:Em0018g305a
MPRPAHVTWPVLWTLFCLAPISEVQAQSRLSVYVDSVLYNSGTAISCRPGATLLFQCEYLVADQPVFQPFPPQLCYQVAAGCVGITTSSPTPPWSSGKLRSNSTISGVASGTTRYYSCQYTTPSVSSYVTILFTDSAVYPANVELATTVTCPPTTTPPTTSTTTRPTTTITITTKPTAAGTTRYSSTSARTTAPTIQGSEGLTDLNPLIYTVVGVFLLGVLAIIIIITCWIRARRMFNSHLVNLRSTTSPFDYLDYISEGDLTPITTTEFIISMQQQRPPTYNQSQELEVLSSAADGNPPSLPPRNGTSRTTDTAQVPSTTPTPTPTSPSPLTRHPNDSVSPEEAEVIESRINTVNRRLIRASRGRGRSSRRASGAQTDSDTATLLSNDRDNSPPNLFEEGHTPSQSEGTQMSLLL